MTSAQRILDLAFQLTAIGAAACAIAVVTAVTRQARQAAEPVSQSPDISRVHRRGLPWGVLTIVGLLIPALLSVQLLHGPVVDFGRASLTPSSAAIVGTWNVGDGGVLVFTRDGRFTVADLSLDLSVGSASTRTRWSGAGTWDITGNECPSNYPGICLTVGGFSELGWTLGRRSSPALQLPAFLSSPHDPDDAYIYDFQRAQ